MSTVFCKYTDVRTIIKLLPMEQIKHMFRVGKFVEIMSSKLCDCGFGSEEQDADAYKYFGKAAFYHDIGKAWVPQEILLKPGKLTEEEKCVAQKHTLFAEELYYEIYSGDVSGIAMHLIALSHDSAVYHHEWWNGMGYPYGVSQKHIPFIARVTAICDVYDAITSDRVYKKARTHEYACQDIERNAGIQFDPALVKVFLDCEAEFSRLFKQV